MMFIDSTIKFECHRCAGQAHPCLRCSQQRSVFDLGYRDGKFKNPKETTGFDMKHTNIYNTGYDLGLKESVK